jgi:hypothetical protein
MSTNRDGTEFDAEQYANIYPPGIEHLYWHQARNRIVTRKLNGLLSPGDRVLDLGCGAGVLVGHLRRAGIDCEGADLGRPAHLARDVEKHLHLGQDVFVLPAEYRRSVSVLLLTDVLEHLPDPTRFLRLCEEGFPNAHTVFVTVPARMEIWSNYDEYNGHYRRYTIESLRAVALPARFKLIDVGHFFHTLYWAARIHKHIVRKRSTTLRTPRLVRLHDLIGRMFDWEERLLPSAGRGASLYAVFFSKR